MLYFFFARRKYYLLSVEVSKAEKDHTGNGRQLNRDHTILMLKMGVLFRVAFWAVIHPSNDGEILFPRQVFKQQYPYARIKMFFPIFFERYFKM